MAGGAESADLQVGGRTPPFEPDFFAELTVGSSGSCGERNRDFMGERSFKTCSEL